MSDDRSDASPLTVGLGASKHIEVHGNEFTVVWWMEDEAASQVEFEVYDIMGMTSLESDAAPMYGDDYSAAYEDGEEIVCGRIKWDGCTHLTFGDEDGYVHTHIDDDENPQIVDVLRAVVALGSKMKSWNEHGAGAWIAERKKAPPPAEARSGEK